MKTSITLTLNEDPVKFATAVLGWQVSRHILAAIRETQEQDDISLSKAWHYLHREAAKYQDPEWDGGGFFNAPSKEQRAEKIAAFDEAKRDLEKLSYAIGGDIPPPDFP